MNEPLEINSWMGTGGQYGGNSNRLFDNPSSSGVNKNVNN